MITGDHEDDDGHEDDDEDDEMTMMTTMTEVMMIIIIIIMTSAKMRYVTGNRRKCETGTVMGKGLGCNGNPGARNGEESVS